MKKKVLVTGATGFIGRHVISVLSKQNFDIHGFTTQANTSDLRKDVNWHTVDLLDFTSMAAKIKKIEAPLLLHLAWYSDHNTRWTSAQNIEWVQASVNLIREFYENGGKRAVFSGSCAEYDWSFGYCKEDTTPLNPQTMYGECKLSLNRLMEKYTDLADFSYASGRIFFVYGPFENKNRLTAHVVRSLLLDEKAKCSHGYQIRDYMYVKDVADALVTLLNSNLSGSVNIATGKPIKLREMINLIGQKLGQKHLINYGGFESKVNDPPAIIADVSSLQKKLKWEPAFGLNDGIDETIKWWQEKLKVISR